MGSLFRSEDMTLCQLYLQSEAAYACTSELGELAVAQFKDLNEEVNAFQRKFVNEIKRCGEMERQLRYFEKECQKLELEMTEPESSPEAPAPKDMVDLEAAFEKHETELKEISNNTEALKRNFVELTELKSVLKSTQEFFQDPEHNVVEDATEVLEARAGFEVFQPSFENVNIGGDQSQQQNLGFVAGVIHREKLMTFMRLLWFACRGNVFIRQSDIEEEIEDLATGDMVRKSVFTIFFQGEVLQAKVKKICEGFKATLYPCPEKAQERLEMSVGVMGRIEELTTVLETSKEQKTRILTGIASNLNSWVIKVEKIKAIYHTMNMYKVESNAFIAEAYCPVADLDRVKMALDKATEITGTSAPSILNRIESEELPTFYRTNKFTNAFQVIIDAYGISTYQEVNPSPWSIITFPFLFSIMFGDAGHGLIMTLFAAWMVYKEKIFMKQKSKNEIWNIFFGGRYLILLMGIFSIYSGFLYNDFFSKPLNIFGSAWKGNYDFKTINAHHSLMLDPNSSAYRGVPYAYGMDPIWQISSNKITWLNSYKKKMSVILGISQMIFGILLSVCNYKNFKQPLNFLCQFLPEIIFLNSLFGYLCLIVYAKWVNFKASNASCAPSLLIGFINMFMFKYPTAKEAECNLLTWYPGQQAFQMFLVVTAVICIPWMLVVKPYYLRYRFKKRMVAYLIQKDANDAIVDLGKVGGESSTDDNVQMVEGPSTPPVVIDTSKPVKKESMEFDFGDVFIHQSIHTIEFCLGCISHTASYLRLWALSLAHAQLSEVLWNMILAMGLGMKGYAGIIGVFVFFPPWAMASVAILLVMEGLSAFLHTLRLHWVEFQSKFYKGEGFQFMPFSFEQILKQREMGE